MDSHRFDALVRALVAAGSRRGLLSIVTALPFAGGLAALLGEDEVDAQGRRKRRKKRHKHGKGRRRKHQHKKHKKHKQKRTCAGDVCASGCSYTSIQDAIDDPDGPATIRLCAETYPGTITIDKDLTLVGVGDGEDGTILDGQDGDRVVTVSTGVTVTLQALRITGGQVNGNGGGISNNSNATLEMTDCTVSGNTATGDGNGSGFGGGIINSGTLEMTDCTVSGNMAAAGGGFANGGSGATLEMTDCTVSENVASLEGGGLLNFSLSTLTLSNCTVSGNTVTSDFGVGGGIDNSGDATLNSCTVTQNMAGQDGGGIWNGGAVTLNDSSVTDNEPNDCVNVGGTGCP